jgi:RNA polymerase sigma-70 factor (ECF subfamily)
LLPREKNIDDEFIQLLRNGDEESIKLIFEQYYEKLCLYAESIVRDHGVAEEIVEDLFIYLWNNGRDMTIKSSLKSYLFRSVHNNCLTYLGKLKTQQKLLDVVNYTLEDIEILHPIPDDILISELTARELEQKARELENTLPEQCRKIYLLNRIESLSYSEIAAQLNISVGTVKTQMSRAFKHFRDNLKEYLPVVVMMVLFR